MTRHILELTVAAYLATSVVASLAIGRFLRGPRERAIDGAADRIDAATGEGRR